MGRSHGIGDYKHLHGSWVHNDLRALHSCRWWSFYQSCWKWRRRRLCLAYIGVCHCNPDSLPMCVPAWPQGSLALLNGLLGCTVFRYGLDHLLLLPQDPHLAMGGSPFQLLGPGVSRFNRRHRLFLHIATVLAKFGGWYGEAIPVHGEHKNESDLTIIQFSEC